MVRLKNATLQQGDWMKQKKKRTSPTPQNSQDAVRLWQTLPEDKTDPNGSYTGRPESTAETPVQDADDL